MVHKKQIIKELAERGGISQKEARYHLNNLIDIIERHLEKGEDVRIEDFCTFFVKQRKETKTVHPRTGEPMIIPSTPSIVVSVSKTLKRKIKNIDKQE